MILRTLQQRLAVECAGRSEPDPFVLRIHGALALALAAIAVLLAGVAGYHGGFAILNRATAGLPDPLLAVLTSLGDTAVALALFLLLAPGNLRLCRVILIASLLGLLWTHGFKTFLPLARPAGLLEPGTFHAVGALSVSQSFPSGHAQTALTLAAIATLCTQRRAWQMAALVAGLLVAFARVSVGMHWPVDVLAGASGGLVCVVIAQALSQRLGPPGPWPVLIVLGLCTLAAGLVALGHPAGYPDAQPWLRAIGLAGLGLLAWQALRPR